MRESHTIPGLVQLASEVTGNPVIDEDVPGNYT